MVPPESEFHTFSVEEHAHGMRIDRFLAMRSELTCSRSFLKQLITQGHVLIDGAACRPSQKVTTGSTVQLEVPPPEPLELEPEDIPLDVLYEDPYLIVVNKPVGMVVHPAPGHFTGTLVHALLHHCTDLSGIGGVMRPGIVHRIDRDTSGVLVVAKTDEAHHGLSRLFKERKKDEISRHYWAIARGDFREGSGRIETPYGRHPKKRQCYSSLFPAEKHAITHFSVLERWTIATWLDITLETGRTHQIRVHMADRKRGLIGDPVYGGRAPHRWPGFLKHFKRQALHARSLSFIHPITQERVTCEAELPIDMLKMVEELRRLYST